MEILLGESPPEASLFQEVEFDIFVDVEVETTGEASCWVFGKVGVFDPNTCGDLVFDLINVVVETVKMGD